MLVLSRKLTEQIRIGDNITISILRVKGNTVRVGIDAPRDVRVVRGELRLHDPIAGVDQTQGTLESAILEASPDADTSQPDEPPQPNVATTAVREFLANRARSQRRSSRTKCPVNPARAPSFAPTA